MSERRPLIAANCALDFYVASATAKSG